MLSNVAAAGRVADLKACLQGAPVNVFWLDSH